MRARNQIEEGNMIQIDLLSRRCKTKVSLTIPLHAFFIWRKHFSLVLFSDHIHWRLIVKTLSLMLLYNSEWLTHFLRGISCEAKQGN